MDPTVRHPDELLAGYVDGSATSEEREMVDRHLATCAVCQEEVQLAANARAALISLPELGAPGLAEAGVLALRRAAFQAVATDQTHGGAGAKAGAETASPAPADARAERLARRPRVAWAQLAAAAAVIVVLGGLVAVPVLLSNGNNKASRSAGVPAAPHPATSVSVELIDRGANYTQASLDALAAQISTSASARFAALGGTRGAAELASPLESPVPTGPALHDSSLAGGALSCVINGGGPPDGAQPIYLERAQVSGTPAYVGGFFIPGAKLNIMVIAVTQDGCQPLYSVRQQA